MKDSDIVPPLAQKVQEPLRATGIEVLQINFGYKCNMECKHCHVKAGPNRSEAISSAVLRRCLAIIEDNSIRIVDITGGSPELHPLFQWFLSACADLKCHIRVRSNGTILLSEEYRHLIDVYANSNIELILSVPHTDAGTTDAQRGHGSFAGLIEVMTQLNACGYGKEGTGLILNLAHNPVGAYLPGSQAGLQSHFRHSLLSRWGIYFNHLFSITNMPVGRYLEYLLATDNYAEYMETLVKAFNPETLNDVMCKYTLSVGWDGALYDCDFNQMLNMRVDHGAPDTVFTFNMETLRDRQITVGNHCYGCTAGSGSSCCGTREE